MVAVRGRLATLVIVAVMSAALAPPAVAAPPVSNPTASSTTATGTASPSASSKTSLTPAQAAHLFTRIPGITGWLKRYPFNDLHATASYTGGLWTIRVFDKKVGEVAVGAVVDRTHRVIVDWAGPAVGWPMARGGGGPFGGKYLNSIPIFLAFAAVFFIGLADWRRPLSMRNLDLVALLGFGPSLFFFDHGHIFSSVTFAYPSLIYLLVRMTWIGVRGRGPRAKRPVWPVWVMAVVVLFAIGFRIGFDLSDTAPVIDVGYSGVVGAQRITHGQSPYGHMPVSTGRPCVAADITGNYSAFIQTNGRCEVGDPHGDTYGPISYEAYIPGYALLGWKGAGDRNLNAGRFTSILFDSLCIIGLALLGWRLGGARPAATLAYAWVTYPFTQYALNSNTNDMIQATFLIFALVFLAAPVRRGIFWALASWVKFAPLIALPMWLTYPDIKGSRRPQLRFALGFVITTIVAFWIVFLGYANPLHAISVFGNRALVWQIGRSSPFSLWDWRQYHAAGIPNLHAVQLVLTALLVIGALAAAVWPRHKNELQLIGLTGALLVGFELVQTHWFYLYIPWLLPFVFAAVLVPDLVSALGQRGQPDGLKQAGREMVAA